ncbi:hypothetical protein [Pantoea sp. A4]|uniref:hypothetical protein n=1 Tax=Pantoea sp. A4 TaxID=1225184 RepID=UPI00036195C3|nr:hypothetical protein [Pantoea sp. A4]
MDEWDEQQRAALAAFLAEGETLAPLMMWQLLLHLDVVQAEGWELESAGNRARIDRCYHALFKQWHLHLENEGLVNQVDNRWYASECAPCSERVAQRIDDMKIRLQQCTRWHQQGGDMVNNLLPETTTLADILCAPSLCHPMLPAFARQTDHHWLPESHPLMWISSVHIQQLAQQPPTAE